MKVKEKVLKDQYGRRIGRIQTDRNGVQTLLDDLGRRLGTYDPRTNVTKDSFGRPVGKGNMLADLAPRLYD